MARDDLSLVIAELRLSELRRLVSEIGSSDAPDVTKLVADAMKLAEDAIADRRQAVERVYTDPNTGLKNKRFFQERLTDVWNDAKRHGREVCMVFIDVDDFKAFN